MITANDFVPRLRIKMKPNSRTPKKSTKRSSFASDDHTKGFLSETRKLEPN